MADSTTNLAINFDVQKFFAKNLQYFLGESRFGRKFGNGCQRSKLAERKEIEILPKQLVGCRMSFQLVGKNKEGTYGHAV